MNRPPQATAPITPPSETLNCNLRGDACALNNMGVSMMLQRNYRSAAKVLKDSISVLRLLVPQEGQPDAATGVISKQKVHEASVLHTQMACTQQNGFLNAWDSHDFCSLGKAFHNEHHFSAVFIRDGCQAAEEIGVGIVLYNYGIACTLLALQADPQASASVAGQKNARLVLFTKAYRSLMLAHSTFSSSSSDTSSRSETLFQGSGRGVASDLEATLFSILTASAVCKLLRLQQDYANATKTDQYIQEMIDRVNATNLSIILGGEGLTAAEAA